MSKIIRYTSPNHKHLYNEHSGGGGAISRDITEYQKDGWSVIEFSHMRTSPGGFVTDTIWGTKYYAKLRKEK